ncbi:hypothetical protein SFRURICE_003928 [Spodoptera frugiperda]|nr:hypothetical protein SFRURICE_003928 [Spodoptera frugiperda]
MNAACYCAFLNIKLCRYSNKQQNTFIHSTLTFHHLCYKSHVIRVCHILGTISYSKFYPEKSPVIFCPIRESNSRLFIRQSHLRPLLFAPFFKFSQNSINNVIGGEGVQPPFFLSIKLDVVLSLNGLEVSPLSHCIGIPSDTYFSSSLVL